jgi:hypothetical protein
MSRGVERAIQVLEDSKAGWVNRRDAVEYLGKAAQRALAALSAHRDDGDTDVRMAVQEALRDVGDQSTDKGEETGYTLKQLARYCAKEGERKVEEKGDEFIVEVQLKGDRKQIVYLSVFENKNGRRFFRMTTHCAEPSAKLNQWALESNLNMHSAAFSISRGEGKKRLMLVKNYECGDVSAARFKRALKSLAAYADWFENETSETDRF